MTDAYSDSDDAYTDVSTDADSVDEENAEHIEHIRVLSVYGHTQSTQHEMRLLLEALRDLNMCSQMPQTDMVEDLSRAMRDLTILRMRVEKAIEDQMGDQMRAAALI